MQKLMGLTLKHNTKPRFIIRCVHDHAANSMLILQIFPSLLQLELLLASAVSHAISSQDRERFLVLHSVFHSFILLMSFWSSSWVHGRVSDPLARCDISIRDFPAEMEEINPIKLLP